MLKFENYRKKYKDFIYKDFSVQKYEEGYRVVYNFSIPELCDFKSMWEFPINYEGNEEILTKLFFNLGMVETISYWKSVCPQNLIVLCGELTKEQCEWWKKLFYNGLGEFLYRNNINVTKDELVHIECKESRLSILKDERVYKGCLVPVGGGKDSIVSLEVLKGERITTYCINENSTVNSIVKMYDCKESKCMAKRILDPKLLELNKMGYLNGHIPFSAVVAFSSVIAAYLNGNKYIVLSNETSANETTIMNSSVNHQYSKSYEFEQDFRWYVKSLIDSDIHYFSLLRPLTEIQIAFIFSRCKKYHKIFRSCNVGSKKGIWCCKCPKCLFVYIILTPFLEQTELLDMFGSNLLNSEDMDLYFRELTGIDKNKPFECVGTRKEVLVALKTFIERGGQSLLTDRYIDIIKNETRKIESMLQEWVKENNVPVKYKSYLERYMNYEYIE